MKPDDIRTAFEGKQFRVDLERWGDAEREIVKHPGSVAIVAIDDQDRVVLVRQRREPARKQLLELPAGPREEGEEPLATAKRELAEEAGLAGGRWRLAAEFYSTPGICDERVSLFFAEGLEETEAEPEGDEQIELERVPIRELEALIAELEDAKTLAGLLLYLRER